MTGAGFGVCAIALIKKSSFEDFKEYVLKNYLNDTKIEADIYLVDIDQGPRKI
jgi:galactokinase